MADQRSAGRQFIILSLLLFISTTQALTYRQRVLNQIFKNYRKNDRPVTSDNTTLKVKVGLRLDKLLKVDIFNGEVSAFLWESQKWVDYQLKWNPKHFDGVSVVHVPKQKIWTPDLLLLNNIGHTTEVQPDLLASVDKDGNVLISKPVIRTVVCSFNMKKFPFDKHTCHWKYGSMIYDASLVDLSPLEDAHALLMDYTPSGEWFINDTEVWSEKNSKYHPDSVEPFVDFAFYVTMARSSNVYVMTLIWPAMMLTLLIPLVFWIPSPTSDKIRLSLATFIGSIGLLLYTLTYIIPHSTKVYPEIIEYFKLNVYMSLGAMIASAIVLNVHQKSHSQPLPRCMKKVFVDILARILCIRSPRSRCCRSGHLRISEDDLTQELQDLRVSHGKFTSSGGQNEAWQVKLTSNLAMLNTNVQTLLTFCKQNFDRQYLLEQAKDWVFVALVLDRLFFIAFLVLSVILLSSWLSHYPSFPL